MKTSKQLSKPRGKKAETSSHLMLPRSKKTGNSEKIKNAKTEKALATKLESPQWAGNGNSDWRVDARLSDLFIVYKMLNSGKEWIYKVAMADDLAAKYSALRRGNTNLEVQKLYDALFRLHLCRVEEIEFGSSSELILGMEYKDVSGLAQIDRFRFEQLQHFLRAAELLKSSLSSELAALAYNPSSAASVIDELHKRFAKALNLFAARLDKSAKKQRAEFYPYKGQLVSLPWLAIHLTNLFVTERRTLPTKIELREFAQKVVREAAGQVAEAAQKREKAAQVRKEAARASEEVAQASEEFARASEEAKQAAKTVAKLTKLIARSTWADTFKTAGLSGLPEGAKFSASRYKRKAVWQNAQSSPTAE